MTSPYVVLPSTSSAKSGWPLVRAFLAVTATVAGTAGAVVTGFIAVIVYSGCFISCEGGNHAGGAALALLAVASLASGPLATSGLYRSSRWMWTAGWTALAGTVLMMMALSSA